MSANNQNGSPEANHYARYEALPPAFRKLLRHCSHDMQVGWIEALTLARRHLAEMRRQTIIQHYGASHPQLSFKA